MPHAPHLTQSIAQGPILWTPETTRLVSLVPPHGIFLTGIEGSDPYVEGVRRNQLREAHDFYQNYQSRLEKIRRLGITWLRFGVPYSQAHTGEDTYDFSFADKVIRACEKLGIEIIVDLLHFGLPDWLHEAKHPYFQNADFPIAFAKYAAKFAERYPSIHYYTLVNEPFITAYLSTKLGFWNEQRSSQWHDDYHFVRAVRHIARAVILGREAIDQTWQHLQRPGEVIYIQNESFEEAFAEPGSGRETEAARFNLRRFAALDLIFGYRDKPMRDFLLGQGMTERDYEWFMDRGSMSRTILGIDHYPSCVHTFTPNQTIDHTPFMPYRLYDIVQTYWRRYPLPLLHTEVNAWPEQALDLCQQTYDTLTRLSRDGYPILGMGWYGDDLQIGWHVGLRGPQAFEESPVGLFYKGKPQPVAELFRRLAQKGFPILASQKEVMPLLVLQTGLT